jgi:DNA adenine methylase
MEYQRSKENLNLEVNDYQPDLYGGGKDLSAKSFLKWAGGKRLLLPSLRKIFPQKYEIKRYAEPFLGGGAVFFDLQPKKAILGDLNRDLIDCLQQIKEDYLSLLHELNNGYYLNERCRYEEIRALDREPDYYKNISRLRRVARFIYLNKTCFNGLFRVNSRGEFNVPFGQMNVKNYLEGHIALGVHKLLISQEIKINHGSFQDTLKSILDEPKKGDFVYMDPPYEPVSQSSSFTGYQVGGFTQIDQAEVKRVMDLLSDANVKVAISNSDSSFIRELYKGYKFHTVSANRAISAFSEGRQAISELVIINY